MRNNSNIAANSLSRKAKQPLDVPALDEDPAERKRILNVLAQRRYRRRKREHVQNLERSHAHMTSSVRISESHQPPTPRLESSAVSFHENDLSCLDDQSYLALLPDCSNFALQTSPVPQEHDILESGCIDPSTLDAFGISFSFPLPSLPSSPSISESTMSGRSLTRSPQLQSVSGDLSAFSRDEMHLPLLKLNLLRGAMAIAKRMGMDSMLWSLDSNSLFQNSNPQMHNHLPLNLRPTACQIQLPHHPLLDILPWPAVRDRLILVFSQPYDIRPPNARSPTALLDLVYDIEDPAEGIRIWGDDPYAGHSWEIGQKLFQNWWWALNSQVLDQSNEMRRNRGASILSVENKSIVEIE